MLPMPVMFPPGRLRLGTSPRRTGSLAAENTIRWSEVARFGGMGRGRASCRKRYSRRAVSRSAASTGGPSS